MATLTVIFLVIAGWAFRRRGAAAGLRGLAVALLPVAAWLTGSLDMLTAVSNAVVDWLRATVRTNQVWAGIGAFAASVLLWLIGTRMRSNAVARERAAKQGSTGGSGRLNDGTPAVAPATGAMRPAPTSTPATGADEDLGDVEEILKRRGIS